MSSEAKIAPQKVIWKKSNTVFLCFKGKNVECIVFSSQINPFKQILFLGFRAKRVTMHGTEYRIGAVVFEGVQNNLPRFGSIEKIVVTSNNNIWFMLKKFLTIDFSQHFHAFEIQKPVNADFVLKAQTDFGTYLPAHVTKPLGSVNGRSYVAPRYSVPQH